MTAEPRPAPLPEQPLLLLTIPELADELRVDERTIYRLLRSAKLPLPVIRIGYSPSVRRADLEAYLQGVGMRRMRSQWA